MTTRALSKVLVRTFSGLVLVGGLGGTAPALAQVRSRAASTPVSNAERANARTHALAAFEALDAGRHEQAVQEFTLALELIDAPTLRAGRADALTKSNRWIDAASDYEAALRYTVLPSDAPAFAESQKTAATKLAELRARTPVLVIQTGDGTAQVTIDDYAWKPVRSGEEIAIDPGSHRVVVTAFGQTVTHRVDAVAGAQINLQGPTQPAESAATDSKEADENSLAPTDSQRGKAGAGTLTTPPESPSTNQTESDDRLLVSGTVTGALAVGAVVTGLLYWSYRNSYTAARQDPAASEGEKQSKYDDATAMAWVNTGLVAATVVGAGFTTYFWLTPRSDAQGVGSAGGNGPSTHVRSALPNGFTLGMGGSF